MSNTATAMLKINKMFDATHKGVKNEAARAMHETSKRIMIQAISNAPVLTGHLVSSAFLDAPRSWPKSQDRTTIRFGFRANYALAVELRNKRASGYLARAVASVGGDVKLDPSRAVRQNIKRIVINV